jgi:uncharacterized protein YndB with AHSA1/START domain
MTAIRPAELAGAKRVVVRRVVAAPRTEVFQLWIDAERMPQWILGGGTATLDVRVGGKYHLDMHYEGKSYPHDGEYLEISPPERLVFTWISEGTSWKPSIVTIELIERGEKTEVVLTHEGLPDDPDSAKSHEQGWTEILEWLERLVAGAE